MGKASCNNSNLVSFHICMLVSFDVEDRLRGKECLVDIFGSSVTVNPFDIRFGMVLLAYFQLEHNLDVLFPLAHASTYVRG